MKPYKIRMEHGRTDPSRVCITEQDQPLFSWAVAALEGERQAAYRLNVGQRGREAWDSGWRFTAGDESDSYMDDPDRSGVYALNTICNYDPDVIPLLDSEPGTAWSRGEDGVFRPELYEDN